MNLSIKILISLVLSVVVGLMAGVDGLPFINGGLLQLVLFSSI